MQKQISTITGALIILFFAAVVVGGVFFFFGEEDVKKYDRITQEKDYCAEVIDDALEYVESKNYCDDVSNCQVVSLPRCTFGLAGEDVDADYIAEIYSKFYTPEGRCWTGEAPECEDPEAGKTIVCEDNRCVFEDDYSENGEEQTFVDCEDYDFDDCPEECYPYSGPSHCSVDEETGEEICTEDIMTGCFSSEYNPYE